MDAQSVKGAIGKNSRDFNAGKTANGRNENILNVIHTFHKEVEKVAPHLIIHIPFSPYGHGMIQPHTPPIPSSPLTNRATSSGGSAVDDEVVSDDEACFRGSQPQHGGRDLASRPDSTDR